MPELIERERNESPDTETQRAERMHLVVRVGFTGHRDLGQSNKDALREELAQRLRAIRDVAAEIARTHPKIFEPQPRVQLVTGVAAGADQAAAAACLELGLELIAVSPFSWAEFEKDFERDADGLARARAIWNAPGVDRVELDASFVRPGPALADIFHQSERHYEALGRFIVGHADVLLAFIDPARESGGAGGSHHVLEQATARDVARVIVRPEGARFASDISSTRGRPTLLAVLTRAVAPPPGITRTTVVDKQASSPGNQRTFLMDDYWRELPPAKRNVLSRGVSTVFDRLLKWLGGSHSSPGATIEPDHDSAFIPKGLLTEMKSADRLAGYYNGLHRTTFLAIYLLGFLAVLSAVLGHLTAPTGGESTHAIGPWSVVEIVSLVTILVLFIRAKRARCREKGTDYRLLAELLRVAIALWPVRTLLRVREARVQGSDGAVFQTWMAWYARSVVRQFTPIGRCFDSTYLLRCTKAIRHDLVDDQIRFHASRSHRFARLEAKINFAVVLLFVAALYGCVAHLTHALPFAGASLVMTAALPALAAALHGIATQAEFSRLERRYHAMSQYLEEVRNDLPLDRPHTRTELESIVQEVSSRMIDEVAEWRWLHAVHDPKL